MTNIQTTSQFPLTALTTLLHLAIISYHPLAFNRPPSYGNLSRGPSLTRRNSGALGAMFRNISGSGMQQQSGAGVTGGGVAGTSGGGGGGLASMPSGDMSSWVPDWISGMVMSPSQSRNNSMRWSNGQQQSQSGGNDNAFGNSAGGGGGGSGGARSSEPGIGGGGMTEEDPSMSDEASTSTAPPEGMDAASSGMGGFAFQPNNFVSGRLAGMRVGGGGWGVGDDSFVNGIVFMAAHPSAS